ncbi:MAG: tetratricopeptide repeat protein [Candidatus Aminicenantes bacterium]|nr:tetratricopeptide repeat protein [Candidatus Aminicenantes bacterium]
MRHSGLYKPFGAALLILLTAGFALGQAGRGVGRLGGIVLDLEGKPIVGAMVSLQFSQEENLKFEGKTDKKGEWSFLGLGTGAWILTAVAAGYDPVTQSVQVSQLNVNPKVTVRLRKATRPGGAFVEDEKTLEILEKGNQLYKDLKFDEAIAAFQEFKALNPKAYQVDLNIADCLREKGEFDQAIEMYNNVIALASADLVVGREIVAKAQAGIGNTYLKQNKIQEAQDFFRKSIENSPKDEVLAYNVGEIYFSNANMDEALKYFGLAAQITPEWPDPYLKLAYVYLNKGDNANAIQQLEKFLTLEPEGERAGLARNILAAIKK